MALPSPSDVLTAATAAKAKANAAAAAKKKSAAAAATAKKNAAAAAAAKKKADAARAKAAADSLLRKNKAAADKAAKDALKQKLAGGLMASNEATSLYVDPTPAYQPALNYLATQTKAANDRYKVNKENISNIFGDLAGLAAKDSVRIRDQFTKSIANQQMGLSNRTAEVRSATAAGEAQMAATGAERGEGPAMVNNPVAVAAEQGIARSNEYQTTWQALQEANQQQAQTDISARGAGYGQQQVGAIQQLAQGLEDRLVQLAGNTAQVQSDIAQAKIAGQQQVAQANYGEIQTAKEQQAALAQEQVKANARITAANISANRPATEKPKKYPANLTGWSQKVTDANGNPQALIQSVRDAANKWKQRPGNAKKTPTDSQVWNYWLVLNKDDPAGSVVNEYIKKYY
jgi:hypothetical protein